MTSISLKGISWNHSRALPPLVATAQRYEELNPGVRIVWEKRTLHEFGHASLSHLADRYDLIVIDHPMMGEAAASLVNLAPMLGTSQMQRLRQLFVGRSFASYDFHGALYALPIDAAAPAASYRPDLLDRLRLTVPSTWDDLLHLARRGQVRMPGFPADLFLNWMALCISKGAYCASDPEQLFDNPELAANCLHELRELASSMPEWIYEANPIAIYEAMAADGGFAYCPFAYTYSNYARFGFAANRLHFAQPVSLSDGSPLRTVLGGTGIAISGRCAALDHALRYSLFIADAGVQRDLYGPAGGQPAARAAWVDPLLNRMSANFFASTRSSIDTAYVRPRYPGYIPLQEEAGVHVANCLRGSSNAKSTIDAVDRLYRASRRQPAPTQDDPAQPVDGARPHA